MDSQHEIIHIKPSQGLHGMFPGFNNRGQTSLQEPKETQQIGDTTILDCPPAQNMCSKTHTTPQQPMEEDTMPPPLANNSGSDKKGKGKAQCSHSAMAPPEGLLVIQPKDKILRHKPYDKNQCTPALVRAQSENTSFFHVSTSSGWDDENQPAVHAKSQGLPMLIQLVASTSQPVNSKKRSIVHVQDGSLERPRQLVLTAFISNNEAKNFKATTAEPKSIADPSGQPSKEEIKAKWKLAEEEIAKFLNCQAYNPKVKDNSHF
ncbi:hypothetical protein FRB94_013704 [Tulasnella sp. JGI-2019a]|nr:hypothetical protein FRB94_013704 [Tulasnella sp. JGI-2019a]